MGLSPWRQLKLIREKAMNQKKWSFKIAALAAAVFAASCAEYEIDKLEKEPRNQNEFNNVLANEYESLAKKESRIYNDEIDARHFAVKGIQAASGMPVLPEVPAKWDLKGAQLNYANDLRQRLMFALDRGGRYIEPELGAQAQVAYDCFIEEISEGSSTKIQKAEIANCRKLAMDSIKNLEEAVFTHGPVRRIYFDYDSYTINYDGMRAIKQVAERIHVKDGDVDTITIIGHTDPLGKVQNNLVLSQNRATAVRKALIDAGVNPNMIKMAVGRGELETSNNAFEPNNRVADIYLHQKAGAPKYHMKHHMKHRAAMMKKKAMAKKAAAKH